MSDDTKFVSAVLRAVREIADHGALRSALRRAARVQDVIGLEAVHRFVTDIEAATGRSGAVLEARSDACMILFAQRNVISHDKLPRQLPAGLRLDIARRLGEKVGAQRRRLSELRFQRLLRCVDIDDRLQQMRRAIALLGAPVHPLAVYFAFQDMQTDDGRRRFSRTYFAGAVDADGDTDSGATTPATE